MIALAIVVFAVGESVHGAVFAPLVVDLAEPRILGRYLALSSVSWEIGFTAGPALAGVMLHLWPPGLWFLSAGVCLVAGALALVLEPRLPRAAVRTPPRGRAVLAEG